MLGKIELDTAQAYAFFDTYVDILTQRHSSELGPLLAGCDVLAWDALHRDHSALAVIEPPIVYCDRGFGASVLREGVSMPGFARNPMPVIQIPYSRLKEKYNLTSVLHEAGHEAAKRLQLASALGEVIRRALRRSDAPRIVQDLYALWLSEIGPDFWGFCLSGIAQVATIKEILALPKNHVFRVSMTDPHPPAYIRAQLAFEWCRQFWGRGIWDHWEREWLTMYPLTGLSPGTRKLIRQAREHIPIVSRVLLNTKLDRLNGRALPELFDLNSLSPVKLERIARAAKSGTIKLGGLSPAAQLAVFRLIREQGKFSEESVDRMMSKWLIRLKRGGVNYERM